jgi:hypothetical protein
MPRGIPGSGPYGKKAALKKRKAVKKQARKGAKVRKQRADSINVKLGLTRTKRTAKKSAPVSQDPAITPELQQLTLAASMVGGHSTHTPVSAGDQMLQIVERMRDVHETLYTLEEVKLILPRLRDLLAFHARAYNTQLLRVFDVPPIPAGTTEEVEASNASFNRNVMSREKVLEYFQQVANSVAKLGAAMEGQITTIQSEIADAPVRDIADEAEQVNLRG